MLEVAVLKEELAIAVVLAITVVVAGTDHRLPRGRATVLAQCGVVQLLAGFGVVPGGAGRLGQHSGIQAQLLVGRWAEVVMGEDGAQAAVDVVHVDQRVGEPALHGCARPHPVGPAKAAEVRVQLGRRAGGSAVAAVAL
ncbi:hypothetical protein D3C78_823620 [compost metagenome]